MSSPTKTERVATYVQSGMLMLVVWVWALVMIGQAGHSWIGLISKGCDAMLAYAICRSIYRDRVKPMIQSQTVEG